MSDKYTKFYFFSGRKRFCGELQMDSNAVLMGNKKISVLACITHTAYTSLHIIKSSRPQRVNYNFLLEPEPDSLHETTKTSVFPSKALFHSCSTISNPMWENSLLLILPD